MCDESSAEPGGACCAPSTHRAASAAIRLPHDATAGSTRASGLITLPGGAFRMGCEHPDAYAADGEGPVREVRLRPFAIAPATVTNAEFAAFIDAAGYVTDAERIGWSFVFAGLLPDDFEETRAVARAQWWRQVYGADWRHPEGPQSDIGARGAHPVVHVSWDDAMAYCAWSSARLPTEAEWEFAARGGLDQQLYPWGDELEPNGEHLSNVWQGTFPSSNTLDDGYYGTAPANSYPPNAYGLYNMTGNVWEWCADWFNRAYHASPDAAPGAALDNPPGPPDGDVKVIRGGSYLCHASYCFRYRVAARSANTPNSSTGNMGFRIATDG